MQVGFIGTGSMGSILIEALIKSGALTPEQIIAGNRTRAKLDALASRFPGLRAARSNIEVALESDLLFLCVKPLEFKTVTRELQHVLLPGQIVVSITSPVLVEHLESELPCKIVKMIPSITNYVLSGATLCVYGRRITPEDRCRIEHLLAHISQPLEIDEAYTRIASDLSSCGPAFLCYFIQRFVLAAVEETGIPLEQASRLAGQMMLGTGKLLTEGGFTPESLQQRVTVPGGITAEGLRMLSLELEDVFNRLVRTTHAKYEEDLDKVSQAFSTAVHKPHN